MADIQLSTTGRVVAPPDLVWERLIDRQDVPSWMEGVTAVVGDERYFLLRLGEGRESEWLQAEVLEVEPERRLTFLLSEPSSLLRDATVHIRIEPVDRATEIEVEVTGRLGAFGTILAPIVRLRTAVALRRAIRGFRSMVEERAVRRSRRETSDPHNAHPDALPSTASAQPLENLPWA